MTRLVAQSCVLLLFCLLTTLLANELLQNLRPLPSISGTVSVQGTPAILSPRLPDLQRTAASDFPNTLARPVFFEGRQFPSPPPTPQPTPQMEVATNIAALKLRGVRIEGGLRQALIGANEQPPIWLSEGASILNWLIENIDAGSVSLVANGQQARLQLYPSPNNALTPESQPGYR